jgi:hypothetical protein
VASSVATYIDPSAADAPVRTAALTKLSEVFSKVVHSYGDYKLSAGASPRCPGCLPRSACCLPPCAGCLSRCACCLPRSAWLPGARSLSAAEATRAPSASMLAPARALGPRLPVLAPPWEERCFHGLTLALTTLACSLPPRSRGSPCDRRGGGRRPDGDRYRD